MEPTPESDEGCSADIENPPRDSEHPRITVLEQPERAQRRREGTHVPKALVLVAAVLSITAIVGLVRIWQTPQDPTVPQTRPDSLDSENSAPAEVPIPRETPDPTPRLRTGVVLPDIGDNRWSGGRITSDYWSDYDRTYTAEDDYDEWLCVVPANAPLEVRVMDSTMPDGSEPIVYKLARRNRYTSVWVSPDQNRKLHRYTDAIHPYWEFKYWNGKRWEDWCYTTSHKDPYLPYTGKYNESPNCKKREVMGHVTSVSWGNQKPRVLGLDW